jgi:hypothetical protein
MNKLLPTILLSAICGIVNAQSGSGFQQNSSCYSTKPTTTVIYVPAPEPTSTTPTYSNYQQGYQQGTQDYQQSHSKLLPSLPTMPELPTLPAQPVFTLPEVNYNSGYQQGIINSYNRSKKE